MTESPDARTRRVLQEHGLPPGLLPPGIVEADITDAGVFRVTLPAEVRRRHGTHTIRFRTTIGGTLTDGAVHGLTGVHARQIGWFAVRRIDAIADGLRFHVGPVTRELPLASFPWPSRP